MPPANGWVETMRVLVLVPAFNESGSLPAVVRELREASPQLDVLIVDDGSTDDTPRIVPQLDARWLRLPQRLGTGAAVRAGLRYAVARHYDVVVRIDGDGQHPPDQIAAVLAPVLSDTADAVSGSRYVSTTASTIGVRRMSQAALGWLISAITGRRITDPTSGLWAFGPRALQVLADHHPSGYPEPELLLFLNRNRLRSVEVPVCMRERVAGRTSLTPQRTGAAFMRLLLLLVVVPLRATVGAK
jgi:glycosyltransferase involved in cell wall biosynthesis